MKKTITLDEALLKNAVEYSGITNSSELIHTALKRFVAWHAAMRLAALGGSQPDFKLPPRGRGRGLRKPTKQKSLPKTKSRVSG